MYTVSPLTSERRACCLTMSTNCPTFPLWTMMNSSLKGRLSHVGLDTSHRWLPWEWTTTRWRTLLKSEQTISTCLSAIIFWLVDWSEINIEIEKMSTLKITYFRSWCSSVCHVKRWGYSFERIHWTVKVSFNYVICCSSSNLNINLHLNQI